MGPSAGATKAISLWNQRCSGLGEALERLQPSLKSFAWIRIGGWDHQFNFRSCCGWGVGSIPSSSKLVCASFLWSRERKESKSRAPFNWEHTMAPNLYYSPSSLTTRGTFSSSSLHALVMPLAIIAQFTIPPKMLTSIASTYKKKTRNSHFLGCYFPNQWYKGQHGVHNLIL